MPWQSLTRRVYEKTKKMDEMAHLLNAGVEKTFALQQQMREEMNARLDENKAAVEQVGSDVKNVESKVDELLVARQANVQHNGYYIRLDVSDRSRPPTLSRTTLHA